MCFSAPASFTAAVVLAAVGTYLVRKNKNPRLFMIALIPYFFAIQQLSEGVLWLYLVKDPFSFVAIIAKNVFLFFAFVFWPIWVPLSLYISEKQIIRKGILFVCFIIGLVVGFYLFQKISDTKGIPYCGSIHYVNTLQDTFKDHPTLRYVVAISGIVCYMLATTFPLFISSLKKMWTLGIFIGVSAVIIYAIDHLVFISMWCFFSAIISVWLLYILQKNQLDNS